MVGFAASQNQVLVAADVLEEISYLPEELLPDTRSEGKHTNFYRRYSLGDIGYPADPCGGPGFKSTV